MRRRRRPALRNARGIPLARSLPKHGDDRLRGVEGIPGVTWPRGTRVSPRCGREGTKVNRAGDCRNRKRIHASRGSDNDPRAEKLPDARTKHLRFDQGSSVWRFRGIFRRAVGVLVLSATDRSRSSLLVEASRRRRTPRDRMSGRVKHGG